MGKTNPLNDKDMETFVNQQKTKPETEQSWNLKVADIDETTFDLSVKNPNTPEEAALRSPEEILDEMVYLDKETKSILNAIKELI
jgi:type I restriction enzyme M protein